MLHTLRGLAAFDTSAAYKGNPKSLMRFVLSIIFLNLLPFLHFSIILLYLLHNLEVNILTILIIFSLSISIFGFDKIFHALLIRGRNKLYTKSELESVTSYSDNMRKKFSSHYLQFLVPGLLYVLIPLALLLLEFDKLLGLILISCSVGGALLVWHRGRTGSAKILDEKSDL